MTTTTTTTTTPTTTSALASAEVRLVARGATHVPGVDLVHDVLEQALAEHRLDLVWLALAALHGRFPYELEVVAAWRVLRLDGATAALEAEQDRAEGPPRAIRLLTGETVVDVHHTATAGLRTGIQRVALEATSRWARAHALHLVAWEPDLVGLRELTDVERAQVLDPTVPAVVADPAALARDERPLLVPWHVRHVVPELVGETPRIDRLRALARCGVIELAVIGFDLIPLTAAETTQRNVPGTFALYLGAVKHGVRVAAISQSAATEYRGFGDMLVGQGLTGPAVIEVALPAEAPAVDERAVADARERLSEGDLPLVLVVGTHEPRKNHLAVLHAAELLWREGVGFALAFIGGTGWQGEEFDDRATQLQDQDRPLVVMTKAPEALLWGGYRAARTVVFPSLHEGFGLPVAEALACGTPALTSDLGSMRELAADGGCLSVDPRDDRALTDALRRLLLDDELDARLRKEARERPVRTWDDYAEQAWQALVGGG